MPPGDASKAGAFAEAANRRRRAINAVHWRDQLGTWCDYIPTGNVSCAFYPSNVFPLLMLGEEDWGQKKERSMEYLMVSEEWMYT